MSWEAQPNCPVCGERIFRTHHCRASAASKKTMPPGLKDLVEEEKAAHRADEHEQEILTLDEPQQVARCRGCGREDRLIVHLEEQLCLPCLREHEAGAA